MSQEITTEYFECQCHAPEHLLTFWVDEEDKMIYINTYLNQYRPWWYRVWVATKYVFGSWQDSGHFDCTMLCEEDIPRLKKLLERIE